jgi:protein-S-isoprenylcysteine O-methyltransferase Ste14
MMSYFLSVPRASWKARAVAVLAICFLLLPFVQPWLHRHDDPAMARWVALLLLIGDAWLLWMAAMVCVMGRMPRNWARGRGALNRTLPHIHAEIAREMREERNRSRCL